MGVGEEIEALRAGYGGRVVVLGHYYQRGGVLAHADFVGDSLELARRAAGTKAERIAFCGVRFMAETADILSGPDQRVYMPDLGAGCPMADMADAGVVEGALARLRLAGGSWMPVVYVNSSVRVKAVCGRAGGYACTSSNAASVMRKVFAGGGRVLFLPDEHLGRNTAADLGVLDSEVAVFDPRVADGGLTDDALRAARVVLWKGFCIVHMAFTVESIEEARRVLPEARIVVHSECRREVVQRVDAHGSTSQILRYVAAQPDGATVLIGTELNFVERVALTQKGRITVKALKPSVCANMAKTNESNLLTLLRDWPESQRVSVDAATAAEARVALERMLAL